MALNYLSSRCKIVHVLCISAAAFEWAACFFSRSIKADEHQTFEVLSDVVAHWCEVQKQFKSHCTVFVLRRAQIKTSLLHILGEKKGSSDLWSNGGQEQSGYQTNMMTGKILVPSASCDLSLSLTHTHHRHMLTFSPFLTGRRCEAAVSSFGFNVSRPRFGVWIHRGKRMVTEC